MDVLPEDVRAEADGTVDEHALWAEYIMSRVKNPVVEGGFGGVLGSSWGGSWECLGRGPVFSPLVEGVLGGLGGVEGLGWGGVGGFGGSWGGKRPFIWPFI